MMPTDALDKPRFNMIEQQIRPWDVLEPQVLDLLWQVRREEFVPERYRAHAFVDMELPLAEPADQALASGRCMLAPRVEARLLQEAAPRPHDKVLEVGAGSGYMAALLGRLAQRVVTLDVDADMAAMARENLRRAGASNVEVREADGSRGLPGEAPFDLIVLSGSVAEIPTALLSQLKVGGRMVAIVGAEPMMRATLVTCTGQGTHSMVQRWDTVAPRLVNFPEPARFRF
jgi:protein-L-isoaspartate(D-aspartate) O-methyltransferase